MFYYLFRVRTNKPEAVPGYYTLNNRYIGYIDFDGLYIRSILESAAKIKNEYQLFATGEVEDDEELHKLNCDCERLSKKEADKLVKKYGLTKSKNRLWYKPYRPNSNSSKTILKALGNKEYSYILNDGIVTNSYEKKPNYY